MRQDYVNARFLEWWSFHPRLLKENIFPQWMRFECKIADPISKTQQMKLNGYLRDGTFEEQLSRLSVSELKDITSSQNLPKGNKKQDIIDIIVNQGCKDLISLPAVLTISDKGLQYLDDHKNMISNDASFIEEYLIRDVSGNIIDVNFDKYGIDFEVNTGPFTLINKSAIKEIINTDFKEISSFLSRINPISEFKATLIYGQLKGLGEQALAAPLAKIYNIEKEDASLLIKTADNYIHTKHEIKGLQSAGYSEYEFMSLGKNAENVCEVCQTLDGKTFPIAEAVIGKNCPPMHIGCRCIITSPPSKSAEEIEQEINDRIASWNIPEGMSVNEFIKRVNNGELEQIREKQKTNQ